MKILGIITAILTELAALSHAAELSQNYVMVDLGTLGGVSSVAYGINNKGQIVGYSDLSNGATRAFLYENGKMKNLGSLANNTSVARAINNGGQVVGYALVAPYNAKHAFIYSNGSMSDIGTLGYDGQSEANGINDKGQIVGYSDFITNNARIAFPFIYSDGTMQNIGLHGDDIASYAYGINPDGNIVGASFTSGHTIYAFSWKQDNIQNIGTSPGNNSSQANAINDNGQIVGAVFNSDGGNSRHPFIYEGSQLKDLGVLEGFTDSEARAINNIGQVVGEASSSQTFIHHTFLYSGESMQDLNNLAINAGSGWTLANATGINDAGQIVGMGINPSGKQHAILLNPLPPGVIETIRDAVPMQTVYGDYPVKRSGKDSLVVITHGWSPFITSKFPLPDVSFVDSMSNAISMNLANREINNWQVYGYKWVQNSWTFYPSDALNNATGEGINLGNAIAALGWSHVHLIGHSAGAEVVQEASERIKAISMHFFGSLCRK